MQDIRNKNIFFMKFGREYIQPTTDQVKEYEISLTEENSELENQTNFSKLINSQESERNFTQKLTTDPNKSFTQENDLLLVEIPKRLKNKTDSENENSKISKKTNLSIESNYSKTNKNSFINEEIKINKKSSSGVPQKNESEKSYKSVSSIDNTYSENLSSEASLGRLFNNYYQRSFLPNGITDTKLINTLILFMKKDLKLEVKHEISITLARTSNNIILSRFLEYQGAEILSNWLHDIKEKIQDLPNSTNSQNYLNNILLNLLIFSEKLNISLKDLKFSKIGKEVNKIAKLNLDNKEIHSKCVALVNKWKRIVEETKEKKSENCSVNINLEKNEDDRNKKNIDLNNLNQSLLVKIISEHDKNEEIAARKFDAYQDRHDFELLHKKKLMDKEKERESISYLANDKNNKKYILSFNSIKNFRKKIINASKAGCGLDLFLFLTLYFFLIFLIL